jgi:LPS export ABC transporter protein LptC
MKLKFSYIIKSIVVSFGITMLFSCKTNPKKMEELSKEIDEPIVSSEDVEWFYTKNGKASFQLNAAKMLRFDGEEPYVEFTEGIDLHSFEDEGERDAYLRADYAIQHLNEKQIEAKGNVLLQNAKGEKLETEYLIWDEQKELIYTEEFVKITQEGQVIMGEGFESDIYFSSYTLKKSRGIINLEHAE